QIRLFWLCFSLALSINSLRAEALRRPVLMIVSGDEGTIRGSSDAFARRATAGREGYAGESLQTGSQSITFAYCPGEPGFSAVYALRARSSLKIGANSLANVADVQEL